MPKLGRVLVTGGSGFLGSYVTRAFQASGALVSAPTRSEFDLLKTKDCCLMIETYRPEVIVHLAATVGGIGANQAEPGRFFYENIKMGIDLLEEARTHDVGKFVQVGTICAYPKHTPVPFREEELWNGYPEETNAPYGIAKRALLVMAQAYRKQYGMNAVYLLPVNLYGPGDHDDLERSHVIPALIRKFFEAKADGLKEVVLWGTGTPTREFLYVEDAAEAIVQATESYNGEDPVNLGTGHELTIRNLAHQVAEFVGYRGKISFDAFKPDGQPRRCLSVDKAFQAFGWKAKTNFSDGLKRTVESLRERYES